MPTYLCHGFRWQRRSVRVFVVVQNLDDASPEWIIPARSSQCILESFYDLFDFLPYCAPPPRSGSGSAANSDDESQRRDSCGAGYDQVRRSRSDQPVPSSAPLNVPGMAVEDELKAQNWSAVKLLEEYDPLRLDEVSRPYAYVADYAVRIDLSVSVFDEMARYEDRLRDARDPPITGPSDECGPANRSKRKGSKKQQQQGGGGSSTGWLEKLRDQLQRGEEIRWYVVVNGDEVRDWPAEPESKAAKVLGTPTAVQARQEHHSHYLLQQQIFEDIENSGKKVTLRSDKEKWEQMPKAPAPRPTKTTPSGDGQLLRPKNPSKGGIRRLFGRGTKGEEMSP